MTRVLRFVLLVVLFFLLLGAVVGFFSQTGAAEKVVLVGISAVLVWLAARVRRMGGEVASPLA